MCTPCMLAARHRLVQWGAVLHSPRWHAWDVPPNLCSVVPVGWLCPVAQRGDTSAQCTAAGSALLGFLLRAAQVVPSTLCVHECSSTLAVHAWGRVSLHGTEHRGELELRFSLVVPKHSGEE